MATRRHYGLIAMALIASGCGSSQPESTSAAAPAPSDSSRSTPEVCHGPGDELTAATGETVRAHGMAVTYGGTSHDEYMDGGFDEIATLTVHGIMDDGSLTPSATGWSPSALAPPRWVHLPRIKLCMRLEQADAQGARFRIFRPD